MSDPARYSPAAHLPPRDPHGHKGTFGTVAVIGGCCDGGRRMIGAPALAGEAALRAGAGLVRIAAPAPVMNAVLVACPSATGDPIAVGPDRAMLAHVGAAVVDRLAGAARCIVVGPGMGTSAGAGAAALRCVQQESAVVVVDADAITLLAEVPELSRDFRAAAVMTPHPGEYRRIAGALGIRLDPANPSQRSAAAESLAQRLGCVVVLKGANTVVTDGQRTWVSPAANAALATGGTGDVLSGLIAGIVAPFGGPGAALSLLDIACLAVRAHAAAAELWVHERGASAGMLAGELAEMIPRAVESMRSRTAS